ncbi:MAG: hypothetical protein O7A08_07480 [SAR324 cluster bacterium]|nr:hypothetical protein [SAR324 cluster bacterium]MCZ6532792.1 hypothetical protein [SAR324 cluster bacterium]MCZ6558656.1 hypothetical protein [SAR324 cluster bacterium]MCZ6646245.1 hypothetical protein [SAR324 cluster bacterium]MCZ6730799.1 hypothetical protein [SAR324 cluster bacterium]
MIEDRGGRPLGPEISQEAARDLLEAAKEAVIHLRDMKAAHGALFQGDKELEMLVAAILMAE